MKYNFTHEDFKELENIAEKFEEQTLFNKCESPNCTARDYKLSHEIYCLLDKIESKS